jgi:P-type E1-E2 ATPase
MIELNIPGRGNIQLEHLVSDVNGTIAVDGQLIDGVARIFEILQDRLKLHLLTSNTHGNQAAIDEQLNLQAVIINPGHESIQKAEYVQHLGSEQVIAFGQGANDAEMLKSAAIGVCVLSKEGTSVEALTSADIIASNIFQAFELIENPIRLIAGLRK